MTAPVPLPTAQTEIDTLVEQEVKSLSPQVKARFLAGAAIFVAAVFLLTYGADLAGNKEAQHYLQLAAVPVVAFVTGWLGVKSPLL